MLVLAIQFNPHVGNLAYNYQQIAKIIHTYQHQCDLIIFPELSITGYSPEDMLFRDDFMQQVRHYQQKIMACCKASTVIIGYPKREASNLYNCAGVIQQGQLIAECKKQKLPNYKVFDEKRYFTPGNEPCVFEVNGHKIGLLICEDLWHPSPAKALHNSHVDLIVSLNASPFHILAYQDRVDIIKQRISELQLPILYINLVGGQDELVFDGASAYYNNQAQCLFQAHTFRSECYLLNIESLNHFESPIIPYPSQVESIYNALVMGLRDYVCKNNFNTVTLGLSGGIDSAVTLAIAVDALTAKNVTAVMLPYHHTSKLSKVLAKKQAEQLGVRFKVINIEHTVDATVQQLQSEITLSENDTTIQNIQARSRAMILMALSNANNSLLLTTGNKSENAVGYSTLYGDMAGGYNVLKDVIKYRVYLLAKYRNTLTQAIPTEVINRPPSAELAPNQIDEDNLPPYHHLDPIIEAYIEQDASVEDIIAQGIPSETVKKVVNLLYRNEYKRFQSAIGPKITPRSFGRDRRYPISNGFSVFNGTLKNT